jgi:hypothetical protein
MKLDPILSVVTAVAMFAGASAWAEQETNSAELAQALPQATVSLAQGMRASEGMGNPISAKFEIANGGLQLSVYTMNRDGFTEVIVDHWAGAIDQTEPITEDDDLKAAGEQGAAMAKAKVKLDQVVDRAVQANSGYVAAEVEPKLVDDRPVAVITLMKDKDVKKVTEKLD